MEKVVITQQIVGSESNKFLGITQNLGFDPHDPEFQWRAYHTPTELLSLAIVSAQEGSPKSVITWLNSVGGEHFWLPRWRVEIEDQGIFNIGDDAFNYANFRDALIRVTCIKAIEPQLKKAAFIIEQELPRDPNSSLRARMYLEDALRFAARAQISIHERVVEIADGIGDGVYTEMEKLVKTTPLEPTAS